MSETSTSSSSETVLAMTDSQLSSLVEACAAHNSAVDASKASSSTSSKKEDKPPAKPPFKYPEYPPHIDAVDGVKFDFNLGVRVLAPQEMPRRLHLRITDAESRAVLHDNELTKGAYVMGSKKFYLKYKIELFDEETRCRVWQHELDMKDQDVLLQMPYEGAIGDSIAWFSYVERFQQQNACKVHLVMPERIRALVEKQYPDIHFITPDEAGALRPYACYYLGLFFGGDVDWQPMDFRLMSLSEAVGRILGVRRLGDEPPRFDLSAPRTIKRPYVCIGTVGSSHTKCWNNPSGWRILTEKLKEMGYRVLCIDKDHESGSGEVWHSIPYGAEDFTGDKPLQERVDLIHHAAFFVGLPSGLSWLAWCCDVPVVMIAGFSMPFGEFYTPYRVQTRWTCNGCWNDTRYEWDNKDYLWCPRHKGTPRAYECTKAISPEMVLDVIKTIPGVMKRHGKQDMAR